MFGKRPSKVFDPEKGFAPPSGAFDMGQHQDDLIPTVGTGIRARGKRPPAKPPAEGKKKILRKSDPNFRRFIDILYGKGYCNFREGKDGRPTWNCDAKSLRYSRAILVKYFPQYDVEGTLDYFRKHGGYCDCEVIFNVAD